MRTIAIMAASHDATEAAAVYAEHNTFHSRVDVQPFKGESVCQRHPQSAACTYTLPNTVLILLIL